MPGVDYFLKAWRHHHLGASKGTRQNLVPFLLLTRFYSFVKIKSVVSREDISSMTKKQKTEKYATSTEELHQRLESGEVKNPVTRWAIQQIIENRKEREKLDAE